MLGMPPAPSPNPLKALGSTSPGGRPNGEDPSIPAGSGAEPSDAEVFEEHNAPEQHEFIITVHTSNSNTLHNVCILLTI